MTALHSSAAEQSCHKTGYKPFPSAFQVISGYWHPLVIRLQGQSQAPSPLGSYLRVCSSFLQQPPPEVPPPPGTDLSDEVLHDLTLGRPLGAAASASTRAGEDAEEHTHHSGISKAQRLPATAAAQRARAGAQLIDCSPAWAQPPASHKYGAEGSSSAPRVSSLIRTGQSCCLPHPSG